jgi:hypothetical protein
MGKSCIRGRLKALQAKVLSINNRNNRQMGRQKNAGSKVRFCCIKPSMPVLSQNRQPDGLAVRCESIGVIDF